MCGIIIVVLLSACGRATSAHAQTGDADYKTFQYAVHENAATPPDDTMDAMSYELTDISYMPNYSDEQILGYVPCYAHAGLFHSTTPMLLI